MRIGFLDNQINERGTTWQAYLYAKYARTLLGHSTVIFYPSIPYRFYRPKWRRWLRNRVLKLTANGRRKAKTPFDQKIAARIMRDGIQVIETAWGADFSHLDALYHIKFGGNDGFSPCGTRYWIHAYGNASQPHGDRYFAISQWLGCQNGVSFVPHIVEAANDQHNFRQELNIPADAVVFGRFGGRDTFDIPWVWEVIGKSVARFENVFFLFANTEMKIQHNRIIALPTMYDAHVSLEVQKRRFINTCDAMLHARIRGEAFGIAVGEFALCGKPVLTYAKSAELAHVEMLGCPLLYSDPMELKHWIEVGVSGELPREDGGAYRDCTPEKVMEIFDRMFIR